VIPINTTLIRVWHVEADPDRDPEDAQPEPEITAFNIRAVISSPTGRERNAGGVQEIVEFSLSCDPIELSHLDRVEDQTTGELYEVMWARRRNGFGLDHTRAGLKQVSGLTT